MIIRFLTHCLHLGYDFTLYAFRNQFFGKRRVKRNRHAVNGVIVEDIDSCMIKFSKCCTPVPGDDIIGYVTRGRGVSVHRADCPNASRERIRPEDLGRWITVDWGGTPRESHPTTLEVTAKDRANLVLDVSAVLSSTKTRVDALSGRTTDEDFFVLSVDIDVKDSAQLKTVMKKIEQLSGVIRVTRPAG